MHSGWIVLKVFIQTIIKKERNFILKYPWSFLLVNVFSRLFLAKDKLAIFWGGRGGEGEGTMKKRSNRPSNKTFVNRWLKNHFLVMKGDTLKWMNQTQVFLKRRLSFHRKLLHQRGIENSSLSWREGNSPKFFLELKFQCCFRHSAHGHVFVVFKYYQTSYFFQHRPCTLMVMAFC